MGKFKFCFFLSVFVAWLFCAAPSSSQDRCRSELGVVAKDEVADVCRLDRDLLEKIEVKCGEWMIVRGGRVCWRSSSHSKECKIRGTDILPNESVTKTLTAVTLGVLLFQMEKICVERCRSRSCFMECRQKLPFAVEDRLDEHFEFKNGEFKSKDWKYGCEAHWAARIIDVLGRGVPESDLLCPIWGFSYNPTSGSRARSCSDIDLLGAIANEAIVGLAGKGDRSLGKNLQEFVDGFLFKELGMNESKWPVWTNPEQEDNSMSDGWKSDMDDLARLGLLLLRDGQWCGEQLLSPDWVHDMTHPAVRKGNPAYGFLTWLNVGPGWATLSGGVQPKSLADCAPTVVCGWNGNSTCDYDVGTWMAHGAFGQLIIGHKGLDMLIVARDLQVSKGLFFETGEELWDQIVPAIVAHDPKFKPNSERTLKEGVTAFCKAYSKNRYAPALLPPEEAVESAQK